MGIFSWLSSNKKRQQQIVRLEGPGEFDLEIVGESHYQNELNSITGGKTHDGHEMKVEALLIHDDNNPYDNQAIAVSIEGEIVGYLDRKLARQFRKRMKEGGVPSYPAVCNAVVVGGWKRPNGDEGHFGVRLDLPTE